MNLKKIKEDIIIGIKRPIKSRKHNISVSQEEFKKFSKVYFKNLTDQEIDHYIEEASPLDKAGGYGIQDWIGAIGITHIEGSYTNVVGLPLAQVKEKLSILVQEE